MTKHPTLDEPGTTIHLVPHFHVDPVWWNTQAASISELPKSDWSASPRMSFQAAAIDVLGSHMTLAERDAGYCFCVAEVDYLAPVWGHFPRDRDRLRGLIAARRVEVVGGTYNSPCTALTSPALVRRNLALGTRFQREVAGATVRTGWQLDAFGHDPGFPGELAAAGLDAVVFARGPYGPWGPMLTGGFAEPTAPDGVQFPTEFEWLSPNGRGVLGVYLASHYSAGYALDSQPTCEAAAAFVMRLAADLRRVSATRHVVLLVGSDLAPPARWLTALPRWFAERQRWPRVLCSLPHQAIDAVREELAASGRRPWPQTRDMNPVYTGKDVSYIDTKQAHRACESLLADAEMWSALANSDAPGPAPCGLDEAWRLLVYASHHDAITGTESDQVYIDLLMGWRRAHDLALAARSAALAALARHADTGRPGIAVVVHNSSTRTRGEHVTVNLDAAHLTGVGAPGLRAVDADGVSVPLVVDAAGHDSAGRLTSARITMLVDAVPGAGHRTVWVVGDDELPTWREDSGVSISNEWHSVTVEPARGGCVASWRRGGAELLTPERLANELVLVPEHPTHPTLGEGPWHLTPRGSGRGTAEAPAIVTRSRSAVGERLTAEGSLGTGTYRSTLTLWRGVDRLDGTVAIHELDESDHLLRLRWPCQVDGAMPVVEAGDHVIGRGFAMLDVEAGDHPWTLDSGAHTWFGLSVAARVCIDTGQTVVERAIGVAEVVAADDGATADVRDLVIALARAGVTSTTTSAGWPRYGALGLDSNAPDVRLSIGLDGANAFSERILDAAAPEYRAALGMQLARKGRGRVWVPAAHPLRDVWVPGLDVRADDSLPVLAIAGRDRAALAAEIELLVAELDADARIAAVHPGPIRVADPPPLPRTVAVVNRGTAGCAVGVDGSLHMSLLRGCTAWPSGQWIDPPQRFAPDGTSFQLQHWSHMFEYSMLAGPGDWREAGIAAAAHDVQRPLTATLAPAAEFRAEVPGRRSAQPTFSRWWVQSRGPVPANGAPVAVRLLPSVGAPSGGWAATVAASSLPAGERFSGSVTMRPMAPAGWRVEPASWAIGIGDQPVGVTFTVDAPHPVPAGHHVIGLVADCGPAGAVFDARLEPWRATGEPLEVHISGEVELEPGGRLAAQVVLVNRTTTELPAEVDVLSPWGSWHLVGVARYAVCLPPLAATTVSVMFAAAIGDTAGVWWWMARAVAGPLVAYSPTASLRVR